MSDTNPDAVVVDRASLDDWFQGLFDKPWIVVYPDNSIVQFDTEEEARTAQLNHRYREGLDPETGEKVG